MPVQMPTTLRRTLGDEAALDFIPYIEKIIVERAIPRDEYRQVLSRLDILERDVADVKVEQREQRREIGEFRQEVNERFDRMNERFDRMNERFDQMYQHFKTLFDRQNRHVETRFDSMNERFDQMYQHFETLFDRQNRHAETRFDNMNKLIISQTRWMVGSTVGFGTLITILLAISQFTP